MLYIYFLFSKHTEKTSTSVLRTQRHTLDGKLFLRARAGRCMVHYGTHSLKQDAAALVHAMLQAVCYQYTVQYREHLISFTLTVN